VSVLNRCYRNILQTMQYQFSKYYNTGNLPEEAKQLYRKKLAFSVDGEETVDLPDPFVCTEWNDDPTKWPDLQFGDIYNFLIFTTGFNCISPVVYCSGKFLFEGASPIHFLSLPLYHLFPSFFSLSFPSFPLEVGPHCDIFVKSAMYKSSYLLDNLCV